MEQLTLFQRKGIEIWTDESIQPGEHWHDEIRSALARAKVTVLLVTPSFLASEYIANHELPNMLTEAKGKGLAIFWIPVVDSNYKESGLGPFQAGHPPSEPLATLKAPKRAAALVAIANKVAAALAVNGKSQR